MNITFRLEQPEDYYTVEALTRDAFWDTHWGGDDVITDVHLLVSKLRRCSALVPELNIVAMIDEEIVGHIIYSKAKIVCGDGKETEVLTFGPLTVAPDFQGIGIGRKLMEHTFNIAKKLGYRAVLIFGHPDYYPRVGFRPASEFGITASDGKSFDPFMAYPLFEGALDGIKGRFYLDDVYESLTQEEALEFDQKFPPRPRELFVPVSIEVLLDKLEPDARRAIEQLGIDNLNLLSTKSEREIRQLEGIDELAVETIRKIMKEHDVKWGR